MRFILGTMLTAAVLFAAVMGYVWWREGSLENAGAAMDDGMDRIGENASDLRE